MKKVLFLLVFSIFIFSVKTNAQQINNSGFEDWENLGTANEEPLEWNSFKTASGALAYLASQQIKRSTVVRPGTNGSYSCLIWSKSIIGITANGNVTTGQINMANATPNHPDNYNITRTAQPAFSETLGATPDSIVFWAKFVPANTTGNDSARVSAVIHDNYDYRDPADAASLDHIVGLATRNFPSTQGKWIRMSIPFLYTGPATSPDFILVTFTTNKNPGGGSGGDSLYIDDISLIYNPSSINETLNNDNFYVYTNAADIVVVFNYQKSEKKQITLFNSFGQKIFETETSSSENFIIKNHLAKGVYIIRISTNDGEQHTRKILIN